MKSILKTDSSNISYFIIRLVLGLVILPHGLQKLLGVFGGYGFEGTMHYFTQEAGIPWILGVLVIVAETFGMLFLIAGVLSRLVSASLILVMLGAALQHYANGFFMNWFGNQAGEGVEFFILAIAMSTVVVVKGAGKWSVDGWLSKESDNIRSAVDAKWKTTI